MQTLGFGGEVVNSGLSVGRVKWGWTPFPRFPVILNAGHVQRADLPIGRFMGWFFVRGDSR